MFRRLRYVVVQSTLFNPSSDIVKSSHLPASLHSSCATICEGAIGESLESFELTALRFHWWVASCSILRAHGLDGKRLFQLQPGPHQLPVLFFLLLRALSRSPASHLQSPSLAPSISLSALGASTLVQSSVPTAQSALSADCYNARAPPTSREASHHDPTVQKSREDCAVALPKSTIPSPTLRPTALKSTRRRHHELLHVSLDARPLEDAMDLHSGKFNLTT